MVRKAAALGYRHCIRDTDVEEQLADQLGRQPRRAAFDSDDSYLDAIREYTEALRETDHYTAWYEATVEPTLDISREVGNWYTGSVHIARVAALLDALREDRALGGEQLLVGSYGSGAQAEIHAETVQPGWREEVSALTITDQVENRRDIDFSQYETIHDVHNHDEETDVEPLTTPDAEFVFDGWGRMGERKYTYVG
jgi:hydroxymethylglutaryl-CoA synthase